MLYDTLIKQLDDKFDKEEIQKKWKALMKAFRQENTKASVKPSGAGTSDIYKPSWPFYDQLKFVSVVCDDTDETTSSVEGPSKPKMKKTAKWQQRDEREEKKLELFQQAVHAMREIPSSKEESYTDKNEAQTFGRYVGLTLSRFTSKQFRRAKKCIGDILFQIEESDEPEAANPYVSNVYHISQDAQRSHSNHSRSFSPSPSNSSY